MPKNWEHGMYLQTRERLFFLCAKSEEDRNMWMSGFRYLLASTVTVQTIMKDNSKILEQKMKERTEKMLEKGRSSANNSISLQDQRKIPNRQNTIPTEADDNVPEVKNKKYKSSRKKDAFKDNDDEIKKQIDEYTNNKPDRASLKMKSIPVTNGEKQKNGIKEQLQKIKEEKE